jgi:CarD family transcriptional regulator
MYGIGDYIVKPTDGICRVDSIVEMDMPGGDVGKLYYLLIPVEEKKQKIYVPVENTQNNVRRAMTEDEAWDFIKRIPEMEAIWVDSEKLREQRYKQAIRSGRPEELIGIIKLTYLRNQKRQSQGKKNTIVDERYFHMAESHLYAELGVALNKNKKEVCQIIKEYVEKTQNS